MFHIESSAGDGEVNVRMLVKLSTIRMQGAEEGVEQGPVAVEKGPQQMGNGESDVLPVAVGKNMALLRYPLLGGVKPAGVAGF